MGNGCGLAAHRERNPSFKRWIFGLDHKTGGEKVHPNI